MAFSTKLKAAVADLAARFAAIPNIDAAPPAVIYPLRGDTDSVIQATDAEIAGLESALVKNSARVADGAPVPDVLPAFGTAFQAAIDLDAASGARNYLLRIRANLDVASP